MAASIYKRGTVLHARYYHLDKLPAVDRKDRYVVVVSDENYHANQAFVTVVKLSHTGSDDRLLPETVVVDDLRGTGLTDKDGKCFLHPRSVVPMPLDFINQRKGLIPAHVMTSSGMHSRST